MDTPRTVSFRLIVALMVVLISGPILGGLTLHFLTRKIPEPLLPAQVRLESIWITPGGNKQDTKLVPCVSIKNPTDEHWKNLSIGLNEQFYAQEPKGVPPHEMVSIPLETFISRNGSVRFPVGNRVIKLVTVFAQIPSGARGVSDHNLDPNAETITPTESAKDKGWVSGVSKSERKK